MLKMSNIKVYDLEECVIACRNSMRITPPEYTTYEFEESLPRAAILSSKGGGSGHSNFRKGIRVSFDILYPNYISPEMQRYGFLDIVCSTSKMHRLVSMDMDACFNEWVTEESKEQMKRLIRDFREESTKYNFMRVISNCPQGIMLFMRCSTNYEQLATIYRQRKNHRLPEWHQFCEFIEGLPYANELILCGQNKQL